MTEEKEKGLDFIEGIVNSMRDASMRCKEFCILICSAIITVYATTESKPVKLIVLCIPILVIFWYLDSFYLYKERFFRKEFKRIAKTDYCENDNSPLLFYSRLSKKEAIKKFFSSMFKSVSTVGFYFPMIVLSLIVFLFCKGII